MKLKLVIYPYWLNQMIQNEVFDIKSHIYQKIYIVF